MGKRVNGLGERTDLRTSQQMYHRQQKLNPEINSRNSRLFGEALQFPLPGTPNNRFLMDGNGETTYFPW